MISIIIPCSGREAHVQRLCNSILAQVDPGDFEVLVVCNPPSSKVKKLLTSYPIFFKYHESQKVGANRARNIGIQHSQGRYLFFFDDDCELISPHFLSERMKLLDQNVDLLGCGGGYQPKDKVMNGVATAYYYIQSKWLAEGEREDGFHRYLIGGNMTLRRAAFEKFGKFNEDMKFGGTETEFFRRLEGQKFLFQPGSEVSHDYKITFVSLIRKAFMQGLGSAFMSASLGKVKNRKLVYGQHAYLKSLEIKNLPLKSLFWYRLSFEAGALYFERFEDAKPATQTIYWEIFKYFIFKKKFTKKYFERRLQVVGNYRKHLSDSTRAEDII